MLAGKEAMTAWEQRLEELQGLDEDGDQMATKESASLCQEVLNELYFLECAMLGYIGTFATKGAVRLEPDLGPSTASRVTFDKKGEITKIEIIITDAQRAGWILRDILKMREDRILR